MLRKLSSQSLIPILLFPGCLALVRYPTRSTSRVRQDSKYALGVPTGKLRLLSATPEPRKYMCQWDASVQDTPERNFDVLPLSDTGLDPEDAALMNDS